MAAMKALLILAAAASGHAGLLVRASATIVRGARVSLAGAPAPRADDGRQATRIVRAQPRDGGATELRLTEFQ